MAKFRQVAQAFLKREIVEFWGNVVKNYNEDVQDSDFFLFIRDNFNHDAGIKLIESVYAAKEVQEMEAGKETGDRRHPRLGARLRRVTLDDSLDDVFTVLWNRKKSRAKCRSVLLSIRDRILKSIPKTEGEMQERRFLELKEVLKLSELEYEILLVAYVASETAFHWPHRLQDHEKPIYYAMALDRSYAEVQLALTAKGKLRRFNLLDEDWDFNSSMLCGYIDGAESESLERRFYGKNTAAEILPWDFYGELAATDGELLKRMLAAHPKKCNILLYGAPGTGKTSFARTLANVLGRTAWEIKQGDDNGKNMKSEARMMGIQICNDQEDADTSLMIVDEADELLRGSVSFFDLFFGGEMGGKSTEKGVMNTILDEMKMPAIWISNAPAQAMDESVRRRFDYSICFEELNNAQRVSIWRNVVRKLGLGKLISEERIADYAGKYATSAGGISTVLGNIKRLAPKKDQVNELLQQMENFNGVMVAATNFCTNLDAAIMRRFTFKLKFDYLDDAGKKSFFERMFKTTLAESDFEELKMLGNLAPGDFRTVRQETFYLNETFSNTDLITALREECLLKKDGEKHAPVGFVA